MRRSSAGTAAGYPRSGWRKHEEPEKIEEIAAHPQVDAVLVGPYDLSISLGVPGQMLHPKMTEAMERVYAAVRANGHAPGYACMGLEDAGFWLKRGVRFFELPSELEMIREWLGFPARFEDPGGMLRRMGLVAGRRQHADSQQGAGGHTLSGNEVQSRR